MSKYYVGVVGANIILNCNKDLSSAVTLVILYRKPDGTTGQWTGSIYNTNYIQYATQANDIDQSGTWRFQAKADNIPGDTCSITFHPLYDTDLHDFTLSTGTNIGKVRYLINDIDETSFALTDSAINTILSLNGNDLYASAAQCMLTIASSKALLAKKISAGNYSEDTTSMARECREAAKMFQEMAVAVPAEAQAEQFFTDFNYREILINKTYRGETE